MARALLLAEEPPESIDWHRRASTADDEPAFPPAPAAPAVLSAPAAARTPSLLLPAAVVRLLESVALYRHDGRWELMYRLAWRTLHGHRRLLEDAADPDVRHALRMAREVARDIHKMHAFVRFREVPDECGEKHYFAWFEPQHEILVRAAHFFERRFPNMPWTIATPDGTAVWRPHALRLMPAPRAAPCAHADPIEDLWRTYYRSICNVARLNAAALQREMPQRYWKHLPESREIASLEREGAARCAAMLADETSRRREPDYRSSVNWPPGAGRRNRSVRSR